MFAINFFGGIAPKIAPHLLAPNQAQECVNIIPVSGEFRAVGKPQITATINFPVGDLHIIRNKNGQEIKAVWKAQDVKVENVPGQHRYAAAEKIDGIQIFAAANAENFAQITPQHETTDPSKKLPLWQLGLPAPKETLQNITDNDTGPFFATSFAVLWDGILYESNLSTPQQGNANGQIQMPIPHLNQLQISDIHTRTQGYEFEFAYPHYFRIGERVQFFDQIGKVIADPQQTNPAQHKVTIQFDNPNFEPYAYNIHFQNRPEVFAAGTARWTALQITPQNTIRANIAFAIHQSAIPADAWDFSYATDNGNFITAENNQAEIENAGTYTARAKDNRTNGSNLSLYRKFTIGPAAIAADNANAIAVGDSTGTALLV